MSAVLLELETLYSKDWLSFKGIWIWLIIGATFLLPELTLKTALSILVFVGLNDKQSEGFPLVDEVKWQENIPTAEDNGIMPEQSTSL